MKKLYVFVFLTLVACPAYCQMDPTSLVNSFFSDYARDGADKALQRLYASSPAPQRHAAEMERQLAELRQLTPENVGAFRNYKLLASRSADYYLLSSAYIVRYEQQPVRFTFTFYRAEKHWGLYTFRIDRDLVTELEESLKLTQPAPDLPLRRP